MIYLIILYSGAFKGISSKHCCNQCLAFCISFFFFKKTFLLFIGV